MKKKEGFSGKNRFFAVWYNNRKKFGVSIQNNRKKAAGMAAFFLEQKRRKT
ncbi:MAG: hypothetical protein ACI3VI_05920 [Vescimonas sp.]